MSEIRENVESLLELMRTGDVSANGVEKDLGLSPSLTRYKNGHKNIDLMSLKLAEMLSDYYIGSTHKVKR